MRRDSHYRRDPVHLLLGEYVFTLGFTVLLAVPLIYHLMMGDVTQLTPFKLILMAYIPVTFFWIRLEFLRRSQAVHDDEELF